MFHKRLLISLDENNIQKVVFSHFYRSITAMQTYQSAKEVYYWSQCQENTFSRIFSGGTKLTLLIWTLSCEYSVPYSIGVLLPKDERKVKKTLQNNAALRNESICSSKYRALHWLSELLTTARKRFATSGLVHSLEMSPPWESHVHPGKAPSSQV